MRKWSFEFYDYDLKVATPLRYDVDEWKSFGISFGREEKTSILKSYNAQFTFINEDADYLKNIVKNRNFSARIGLNIYLETKLYYQCRLELYECKIEGFTFQCPVYVGGLFALLDNEWNVKRTISNRKEIPAHTEGNVYYAGVSLPDADFEDIKFSGGGYKYEKVLEITEDSIEVSRGVANHTAQFQLQDKANYIPLKNASGDEKLKFFQESTYLSVKNNSQDVTMKQMFVISEARVNAGSIVINGDIGRIRYEISNNDALIWNKEYDVKLTLNFMLCVYDRYTTDENAKWKPSEHSLIAVNNVGYPELVSKNYTNIKGKVKYDSDTQKYYFIPYYDYNDVNNPLIHFENISFDTSWISNTTSKNGYMLALCMSVEMQYYYSGITPWRSINGSQDLFAEDNNIKVFLTYEDFKINQLSRKICGIRPSVLFKKMIDNINGKGTRYDANGNFIGNYSGDYNVNIDLSVLENADAGLMLFSDTMCKGDLNNFAAGMMTSLEDLCKFIYVNMGLKMCCIYDRLTDTYNISFKSMEDIYTSAEVCELDGKTTRVAISATSDLIYSHVVVGYNNLEECIMGQKEYNTKNTFKTEHKERPQLDFELVSLYKGGCFDVETIVYTMQGNEDTDVNSDNIFVLEVSRFGGRIGVLNKVYNVQYKDVNKGLNVGISPKRVLKLHKNELTCIRQLNYETSMRDADFEYMNVKENADEDTIGVAKLYSPFTLQIKSSGVIDVLNKIESNPFGLITFKIGGRKFSGYLANATECVSINPMNEQESEFLLFSKNIPF